MACGGTVGEYPVQETELDADELETECALGEVGDGPPPDAGADGCDCGVCGGAG